MSGMLPDVVDAYIQQVEGGFQADPDDPGNWTPDGRLVGTKWGISAAANPDVDIPNLTWEAAERIYALRYWTPSGAATAWTNGRHASALITFDSAVHSGVSTARAWRASTGGNNLRLIEVRLDYLTGLTRLWRKYGRGWTRRIAYLLSVAADLDEYGEDGGGDHGEGIQDADRGAPDPRDGNRGDLGHPTGRATPGVGGGGPDDDHGGPGPVREGEGGRPDAAGPDEAEGGKTVNPVILIFSILDELRGRIRGDAGGMEVLDALRPLLEHFANFTRTDVSRQALQEEVHEALRRANLIPTEDL